jgi:hypothetical protein
LGRRRQPLTGTKAPRSVQKIGSFGRDEAAMWAIADRGALFRSIRNTPYTATAVKRQKGS